MRIIQKPSPNFNRRKQPIDMLVLHYTGMETGEAAEARLCDPAAEVSAHYVVREDGVVVAMVPETERAWHAGVAQWQGHDDINSRSIGIEIVNGGHDFPLASGTLPPYPAVQIAAVISLASAILRRHAIPQTRIVGHSDIAPSRKADPGEHFPWQVLSKNGIGLLPTALPAMEGQVARGKGLERGASGPSVSRMADMLGEIGYHVPPGARYGQAV
ncbi:MAG: N-acetylmuramoyl-L-alanine amidase, partial [Pseudomonadota bacterium]